MRNNFARKNNIPPTKIFICINTLILIADLIILFALPENTPNFVFRILVILLFLTIILVLIGTLILITTKIKSDKKQSVNSKILYSSKYIIGEKPGGKIVEEKEIEKKDLSVSYNKYDFQGEKGDVIFRMEAKTRYMVYTNLGGIIFGIIILFSLLTVRKLYTLILFLIGATIIILYMVIDYLIWQKKGIRIIEIDKSGINLYRGKKKEMVRIEKNQITDIDFFTKLGRRVVTILIGGSAIKPIPGITFFAGPRIRITDDSFNDNQFTIFIEKLKEMK